MAAAKVAVSVLTALFLCLLAFVFFALGYRERSLDFIAKYNVGLFAATSAVLAVIYLLYLIFYILKKQSIYRFIFCVVVCLDFLSAIFYFLSITDILPQLTSISDLRKYIAGFGASAVLMFILFQFLQVIILPVPGSVSVGVGVALFGPLRCSVFSFIGILLGSFAAFAIGRVIGYKAVCWIVGEDDLKKWLKKLKGKDYLLLSIMFLFPLFPDDILCFVAGLSSMTWKFFAVMITITRAVSIAATAFSLQLIPFTTWWGLVIWAAFGIFVGVMFWAVCRYSAEIDSFIKKKFKS